MLRRKRSADFFKIKNQIKNPSIFSSSSEDLSPSLELDRLPIISLDDKSHEKSIKSINQLIEQYNRSDDPSIRYPVLCQIYAKINRKLLKPKHFHDEVGLKLKDLLEKSSIVEKLESFHYQFIQSGLNAFFSITRHINKDLFSSIRHIQSKISSFLKNLEKEEENIKIQFISIIQEIKSGKTIDVIFHEADSRQKKILSMLIKDMMESLSKSGKPKEKIMDELEKEKTMDRFVESMTGKKTVMLFNLQLIHAMKSLEDKTFENKNIFIFINQIINIMLDIKMYAIDKMAVLGKISIKNLNDLFIDCNGVIELSIKRIKTDSNDAHLLRENFNNQLLLSPTAIRDLRKIDCPIFENLSSRLGLPYLSHFKTRFLGGNTNPVYDFQYENDHFIVKFYQSDDKYHETYEHSIHVRERLGRGVSQMIGNIYLEKDIESIAVNDAGELSINTMGRVEVAEQFPLGNLSDFVKKTHASPDDVHQFSTKILEKIIKLNAFGIVFPDAKPSNFFVSQHNERYTLRISDYKTLFICENMENFPVKLLWRMGTTESYWPPEMYDKKERGTLIKREPKENLINVDLLAMQKYAIGLTLYELATGDEEYKMDHAVEEKKTINIDHPVFKDAQGQRLLSVIQSLMADNPKDRMDFEEALSILKNRPQTRFTNGHAATIVRSNSTDSLSSTSPHQKMFPPEKIQRVKNNVVFQETTQIGGTVLFGKKK